ncbi:MAG: hypothetical protein RBT69_01535 [Spirochaetia bacterium]|jgi:hypothetical protein|nr:hypothetical protein [Spirochaetia bacterium]
MKNKIFIAVLFTVLTAAVAVFSILNSIDIKNKMESRQNSTVAIIHGNKKAAFDISYLKTFKTVSFRKEIKKKESGSEEIIFTGVPLITVLHNLGFTVSGTKKIIFSAEDGFTSSVASEEAIDPDNIYLVYERSGNPSGAREDGGTGPIEIVIRKDSFPQRWCRFLLEIEIE